MCLRGSQPSGRNVAASLTLPSMNKMLLMFTSRVTILFWIRKIHLVKTSDAGNEGCLYQLHSKEYSDTVEFSNMSVIHILKFRIMAEIVSLYFFFFLVKPLKRPQISTQRSQNNTCLGRHPGIEIPHHSFLCDCYSLIIMQLSIKDQDMQRFYY